MASKPVLLETMATSASMFLPLANVIVSTFAATAILAFELAEATNTPSFSAAETIAVVFVSSDGSIGGLGLNDIRGKSIQQKCKLRDYVLHVSFGSQLPRHSHGKVGNTMTIIVKQCCGSVIPGPNSRKDKKPVKDCKFDFPRNYLGVIAKFSLRKSRGMLCARYPPMAGGYWCQ